MARIKNLPLSSRNKPKMLKETEVKPGKINRRLRYAFEFYRQSYIGKINVEGQENLDRLKDGPPVIFAVSHITKEDVPVTAYVLSKQFDIKITALSGHMDFKKSPGANIGLKVAGTDNFIPIDFVINKDGKWQPGKFNPENFDAMVNAIKSGKSIVTSAHNPLEGGQATDQLPENTGYSVAYLAQKTGARIVPVAVNLHEIQTKKGVPSFLNKPDVDIVFGSPLTLDPIDIETLSQVPQISPRERTDEDRQKFHEAHQKLKSQGEIVMRTINDLLPKSRRGKRAKQA